MNEKSDVSAQSSGMFTRIASICTVASLTSLAIDLVLTWTAAWRANEIPSAESWGRYRETGNGPWNHNSEMTVHVDYLLFASAMTLLTGVALVILARSVGLRRLGAFACLFSIITFWFHFPLID